jgi:hypothetical protein
VLPTRKAIKDIFDGLLGREVSMTDGDRVVLDGERGLLPVVASYVDDHNRLATVAVMDFKLAAFVGAALGLVPVGAAEDAIADKDLYPNLLENTAEVLNVLAAPIGDASPVHQRLFETFEPGRGLPADVAQWAATIGVREDVKIDVPGYGAGNLSIVTTLA